ncbi:MAG: hypothetical protein B7Z54_02590 [Sphingobacteriales bacterium 12-47-4]|nr:MAG: hypothetical protein B7Z54_02590 [Sphingobacteriales bacterium 12-47-4]
MKKIIFLLFLTIGLMGVSAVDNQAKAQDAEGWFAALDTMTNADTATYDLTVTGAKHSISFQTNILKISGTVGGTINVYGSVDGTNFLTTAIGTQITIANASGNYGFTFGDNRYKKYRIVVITSGTQSCSQRTRYMYRRQ